MNVNRRLPDGSRKDDEVVNKSQIYVTTAGWKNTFAYQKLMMVLTQQIINPKEAIILGGSWRKWDASVKRGEPKGCIL